MFPDFKADLQRVVLPILATGEHGLFEAIGTGFVVGAFGRQALVLSAAHNFDHIRRLDRPYIRHHPSTPFFVEETDVTLSRTTMRMAFWDGDRGVFPASVDKVWISNPLDIAVCSVRLGEDTPPEVAFQTRLAIDTAPPSVGDQIAAVGYADMEAVPIGEAIAYPYVVRMEQRLDWREGTITEVFNGTGPRGQPWPSFQCNVGFDSGMSGGPIIAKKHGDVLVACGVISTDSSLDSKQMRRGSGLDAIAAMLWPAMVTSIPIETESGPSVVSLVELQRQGFVDDRGDAARHIIFGRDTQGEIATVRWTALEL